MRERLLARLAAEIELDGDRLIIRYGSHAELAETVGTAREVVSREIGRLRDADVLRSPERGILEVLDPGALGSPEICGR